MFVADDDDTTAAAARMMIDWMTEEETRKIIMSDTIILILDALRELLGWVLVLLRVLGIDNDDMMARSS